MSPRIETEADLEAGLARLLELDPRLQEVFAVAGRPPLRKRAGGFHGLARIVVSQQLSVASAGAIFNRLEAALARLDAANLLEATDETLRACGLSSPKIRALRSIAEAVGSGRLDLPGLAFLDAEAAHAALVSLKGIGPWTADIFLLFCLGHPDAFPAADLALQEAAKLALKLKTRPDEARLERIAERWRPYRGVAARMLWAYYRGVKQRSGVVFSGEQAGAKA
jgi:DNA-3-methyladenine glycosylase II